MCMCIFMFRCAHVSLQSEGATDTRHGATDARHEQPNASHSDKATDATNSAGHQLNPSFQS